MPHIGHEPDESPSFLEPRLTSAFLLSPNTRLMAACIVEPPVAGATMFIFFCDARFSSGTSRSFLPRPKLEIEKSRADRGSSTLAADARAGLDSPTSAVGIGGATGTAVSLATGLSVPDFLKLRMELSSPSRGSSAASSSAGTGTCVNDERNNNLLAKIECVPFLDAPLDPLT